MKERNDEKFNPVPTATIPPQPKWARRLWPSMSWLVFLVNLAGVISTIYDLWNGDTDNLKYVTVIMCACVSYASLKYIHENIIRYEL